MTKKIHVDGYVLLPLHICRRHLSPPVSENVPNSQSSAYRQKCYHLFKENVLKKYTFLNLIFGKYLEPWKDLTRCGWSKKALKMLDYIFFLFQRYDNV